MTWSMTPTDNKPAARPGPATHGGQGWQPRADGLAPEIAEGRIWRSCGSRSEWGRLKEVVLSWPGEEINFDGAANDFLMLARPDLATLRRQTEAVAEFYRRQGITVHLARPSAPPPPNFLFMRDLFWATPAGVVLARPAARQRAGEERYAAEALARLGVPMILHPHGTATFEGADALWLDARTVLMGTGFRTNAEGVRQLRWLLAGMGITVRTVPLPPGTQHLLGVLNFVREDQAVLHGGRATASLGRLLTKCGVRTIVLPPDEELYQGLGMNFVTLAPGRIVMPDRCPGIRRRLEGEGIEVAVLEIGEYLKAAGGLACLTGILSRE